MAFILSAVLLLMAAISVYYGYQIYKHMDMSDKTVQTICILSFFGFLWCFGYGWMSTCNDYNLAYIARAIALAGVFGYMFFIVQFVIIFTKTKNVFSKIMTVATLICTVIDYVLIIQKSTVTFVSTFYGTYYYSHPSLGRKIQLVYSVAVASYCVAVFVRWTYCAGLKRERQVFKFLIFAGTMMPIGALLDTLGPVLGKTAIPGSPFGVFLTTTTLYLIALRFNAIRLTTNNISDYIFENVGTPIVVLNYKNEIELFNSSAKEFFQMNKPASDVKKMQDIFEISAEDAEHLLHEVVEAKEMRNCVLIERNTKAVCDLNINPVMDKYGELICNILFAYDMTKEYNMMTELEELQDNLSQKLEEKTKQVESVTLQAITTVASIVDDKDEYTKGHSVRVAEYARELAKRIGCDDDVASRIHYVALLHDIGKIGVPESILNKPSKLTEAEFDMIKNHTLIGADILKDITSLKNADIGAKYHHERYDGTGYPYGLTGEEIPIIARIIGIADAFDAMNSDRVYRKHLSMQEISDEIKNERGKQFDPILADVFLQMIEEGFHNQGIKDAGQGTKGIIFESGKLLSRVLEGNNEQKKIDVEKDYLTNLMTRRSGERKIMNFLKSEDGCLMIIDLDNFKAVNDNYGHLSGDYALKIVAEVLLKHNHNAIICRVGGDEFIFFLKGVSRAEEVIPVVEGIIYTYNNKCSEEEILKETSLSIGIALSAIEDREYTNLFNCADKALYYVKQNGKCGYSFFNKEHLFTETSEEARVDLQRLVAAIKHKETYQGVFKIEFREFSKIFEFVEHYTERNNQKIQLVLFTLTAVENRNIMVESMEMAMRYMEEAISSSLRGVDVSTRFSSAQYLVILVDTDLEGVKIVTERILNKFSMMYRMHDMILNYDVANLDED